MCSKYICQFFNHIFVNIYQCTTSLHLIYIKQVFTWMPVLAFTRSTKFINIANNYYYKVFEEICSFVLTTFHFISLKYQNIN